MNPDNIPSPTIDLSGNPSMPPPMSRNEARHQKKQMKKLKKRINGIKFKETLAKRGYLDPSYIVSKPSPNDQNIIEQIRASFGDDHGTQEIKEEAEKTETAEA